MALRHAGGLSRYSVLALGVAAAAVCGRLGLWQLDRLSQRREANARITVRLAEPPVEVESLLAVTSAEAPGMEFRRARLTGRFDFEREVLVVARSLRGVPGVHVVTPLVLATGDALLVERGWAPAPDGRSTDLLRLREPSDGAAAGVLLVPRGSALTASDGWPIRARAADPEFLGARFPYRVLPVVLRRDSTAGAPLRAVPLPEVTEGPHLSYAVQWFAFGIIALVGSVVLVRKAVEGGEGR